MWQFRLLDGVFDTILWHFIAFQKTQKQWTGKFCGQRVGSKNRWIHISVAGKLEPKMTFGKSRRVSWGLHASQLQSIYRQTATYNHIHTKENLETSINLKCWWSVGGRRSSRSKPMQKRGVTCKHYTGCPELRFKPRASQLWGRCANHYLVLQLPYLITLMGIHPSFSIMSVLISIANELQKQGTPWTGRRQYN